MVFHSHRSESHLRREQFLQVTIKEHGYDVADNTLDLEVSDGEPGEWLWSWDRLFESVPADAVETILPMDLGYGVLEFELVDDDLELGEVVFLLISLVLRDYHAHVLSRTASQSVDFF